MTNGQRLKKIRERASQIHKQHPGGSYQVALRKAGKEFREKNKKVSGTKKHPKHKSTTGRGRKKGHARTIGAVPSLTHSQVKSKMVKSLEEQLAWALLAQSSSKNKTERKKEGKHVSELKRKLKAAHSL